MKLTSLKDASRSLGVKPHQIQYAIATGHIPEPRLRFENKRVFAEVDLERLAVYFGLHSTGAI